MIYGLDCDNNVYSYDTKSGEYTHVIDCTTKEEAEKYINANGRMITFEDLYNELA